MQRFSIACAPAARNHVQPVAKCKALVKGTYCERCHQRIEPLLCFRKVKLSHTSSRKWAGRIRGAVFVFPF